MVCHHCSIEGGKSPYQRDAVIFGQFAAENKRARWTGS
jgi:hypothetical protein